MSGTEGRDALSRREPLAFLLGLCSLTIASSCASDNRTQVSSTLSKVGGNPAATKKKAPDPSRAAFAPPLSKVDLERIARARTWKVHVESELPESDSARHLSEITESFLQAGGVEFAAKDPDATLCLTLTGEALSGKYAKVGQQYSRMLYSGAKVEIGARIQLHRETWIECGSFDGRYPLPLKTPGGELLPSSAPFEAALRRSEGYLGRLCEIVISTKGPTGLARVLDTIPDDPWVRKEVIRFMGASGDRFFVPALLAVVTSKDVRFEESEESLFALIKIKDPESVGVLSTKLISKYDAGLHKSVLRALGEIGGPQAIPPLRGALDLEGERMRYQSELLVATLEKLEWSPETPRQSVYWKLIKKQFDAKNPPSESEAEILCRIVDSRKEHFASDAAEILGRAKFGFVVPVLERASLESGNDEIQTAARRALRNHPVEGLSLKCAVAVLELQGNSAGIRTRLSKAPVVQVIDVLTLSQGLATSTALQWLEERTGVRGLGKDAKKWRDWWTIEGQARFGGTRARQN